MGLEYLIEKPYKMCEKNADNISPAAIKTINKHIKWTYQQNFFIQNLLKK